MNQNIKVTHVLFNPFTIDARVQKELRSIEKIRQISIIELLCLYVPELPKEEIFSKRVNVRRILRPLGGFKIRALKHLGFVILNLKFLKRIITTKPDIVHCHDLITLPVGVIYKLISKKTTIIYDAHEFETEVQSSKGLKRVLAKVAEKILMVEVDHLISVSQSIIDNYVHMYGDKPSSLIKNVPYKRNQIKSNLLREKFNIPDNHLIILYQGIFVKGRGIEKILYSFKQLTLQKKSFHLVFMGKGDLEELILEEAKNDPYIHYQPFVDNSVVLEYTASADIGLCLIENCCRSYYFCLPNKLFEYIAAGIPVIATDLFELKKFMIQNKVGLVVNEQSYDLNSLMKNLTLEKISEFKSNCISISKELNWDAQEPRFLGIYQALCCIGEDQSKQEKSNV